MWDLEWFKISIRISERLGVPTEKRVISNSSLHKSGDLTPAGVCICPSQAFASFRQVMLYIFLLLHLMIHRHLLNALGLLVHLLPFLFQAIVPHKSDTEPNRRMKTSPNPSGEPSGTAAPLLHTDHMDGLVQLNGPELHQRDQTNSRNTHLSQQNLFLPPSEKFCTGFHTWFPAITSSEKVWFT